MWEPTSYPLSEDQFQKQLEWLVNHRLRIMFLHTSDIKFRHAPNQFYFVYTFVNAIEEVLNSNISLKKHIYGDDAEEFRFTTLFLENEGEFYQFWSRQIARTEKFDNIQFGSYLNLFDSVTDECFNVNNKRLALDTPTKV